MRTTLIVINLLVAAASLGLFGYTFFARDHLVGLAEDYVVERTVANVTPAVEPVEAALAHPLALLAPAHIRDAVKAEVNSFRRDPHGYVRALVKKGAEIELPKHWFTELVLKWKRDTQDYFEQNLASLIRDLRIFSGTNVVAALLAAFLASRARGRWRWYVLLASALLLVALALNVYLFIDDLTFFRIIVGVRAGWSYPLFVALTFGFLYLRVGLPMSFALSQAPPLTPPAPPNPPSPQKPTGVG